MTDWRYVFVADFGVRSYQVKITFGTGFTARISNRQLIIPRRLSIPFKKRSPENGWFCFFGYIFDTIPNLGHTMRRKVFFDGVCYLSVFASLLMFMGGFSLISVFHKIYRKTLAYFETLQPLSHDRVTAH